MRLLATIFWLLVSWLLVASAQQPPSTAPDDKPTTVFPHPSTGRFWLSGQMNLIFQTHPPFHAPYGGENSLNPHYEKATSRVLTLFTGVQLARETEVLFDLESTGGRGIIDALGLAGFTNLDVVRNPNLGSKPYIARLMLHQTVNYGRENIVESYYTAHLWRGVFAGVDVQYIVNPGYNRDRGPVVVPGLRAHVEF